MRRLLFTAALLLATPALAQTADIQADNAWARATPGTVGTGAVFLTLIDHGAPDTLTGASTPVAGMAMVHESIEENGVEKMRMLDGVNLMPHTPVVLKPGAMHIMLTELKHPLHMGDSFPLTLTFAHAAPVTVTVHVLKVGSPGPADMSGDMKGMKDMPGMKGMTQ